MPYATGAALGLLAATSLVAFRRPLGISGGIASIGSGTWTWGAWVVMGGVRRSSWLLGVALVFGWTAPMMAPALLAIGDAGTATLPSMIGVSSWLLVVLFAEAALLGHYALERGVRRG